MCYETGLTAPGIVKGIGVLSGRLSESLSTALKPNNNLSKLKIFIAHGTADSRIPYAEGKAACDILSALSLKPEFQTYQGMDHTITNEVMADLLNWLKK
jgi:phospholipase/carboxylesterase